jgi:hypothetical protein
MLPPLPLYALRCVKRVCSSLLVGGVGRTSWRAPSRWLGACATSTAAASNWVSGSFSHPCLALILVRLDLPWIAS